MHVRLFSQTYIATQIRGGDTNEFFSHKTLKHPPSLSKCGQMCSGNKSDLIGCIEEVPNVLPRTEAAVLEGSVLINMVKAKRNQSFQIQSFQLQDDSIAPINWHSFPRLDENKIDLFRYLSQYLVKNLGQNNTQLVCSFDTMSISSDPDTDLSFISPCNHEEADTRVFLHTKYMALKGHKSSYTYQNCWYWCSCS